MTVYRNWLALDSSVGVKLVEFNVKKGEHPPEEDWNNFDGFIVGGSLSSAYEIDRVEWIRKLEGLLKRMSEKECKILGICFGHQIIAQTFGGKVVSNPKGTDFAARSMAVDRVALATYFPSKLESPTPDSVRLFVTHSDIVVGLPPGAKSFASSAKNAHELVIIGDNIVTVQAHPEFGASAKGKEVYRALTEDAFAKKIIDDGMREEALDALDTASNDDVILRLALQLFQDRP